MLAFFAFLLLFFCSCFVWLLWVLSGSFSCARVPDLFLALGLHRHHPQFPRFPSVHLCACYICTCSWRDFRMPWVCLFLPIRAHSWPFLPSFRVPPSKYTTLVCTLTYPSVTNCTHPCPSHTIPHHPRILGKFPRPLVINHAPARPSVPFLASFLCPPRLWAPTHASAPIRSYLRPFLRFCVLLCAHAIMIHVVLCFCLFCHKVQ